MFKKMSYKTRNWILCRVYTCRFDNQVQNEKLVEKYFCVVKVTRYIVYEEIESLLEIAVKKFEF